MANTELFVGDGWLVDLGGCLVFAFPGCGWGLLWLAGCCRVPVGVTAAAGLVGDSDWDRGSGWTSAAVRKDEASAGAGLEWITAAAGS